MKSLLLVPVQIEALVLTQATPVREALADFTALPYSDGQQDYNPDVAYLSEEVVTMPLQDKNLVLPAGTHLHWYLPGVLTKTKSIGAQNTLPAVPDRWVVTRYRHGSPEKNWLIESDFLTSEACDNGMMRCHVPYYDGNPRSPNRPYRFLGKVTELANSWQRNAPLTDERIEYLTAVGYEPQAGATGYGEPTFAAFYPHCSSVFGFYDQEITSINLEDSLGYQVLGFYARPDNDYLTQFITDFITKQTGKSYSIRQLNEQLQQAISQEFSWEFTMDTVSLADGPAQSSFSITDVTLPKQSFFSARIELSAATQAPQSAYKIAVGNTGTEALAAFLATSLTAESGEDKAVVEDRLEAVQLTAKLNNRSLDLGAKFREARHEKGFSALASETHWTVVVRSTGGQSKENVDEIVDEQVVSAADLHLLNALQLQYNKAQLDLEIQQRHLFADWNKYMLCAYPPPDNQDAYPNIDEVKDFIEQNHFNPILNSLAAAGTLLVQQDELGHLLQAAPGADQGAETIAAQLALQLNKIVAQVAAANTDVKLIKSNKQYALKPLAGPRYWRPNDPVVLLARQGDSNAGTPVGGRDPRAILGCIALELNTSFTPDSLDAPGLVVLQEQAQQLYESKQLAATSWTQNPWQPFLLEWEAELSPVSTNSNLLTPDKSYTHDFIASNYQLDETETDFRPLETSSTTSNAATVYSGMSILTPNASIKLEADLKAYLSEWMKVDFSGRYFQSANVPATDRTPSQLAQNLGAFGDWALKQVPGLSPLPAATDPDLGNALEA